MALLGSVEAEMMTRVGGYGFTVDIASYCLENPGRAVGIFEAAS